MCTTGDMAHIDMIFSFLPHTRQQRMCGKNLNIISMCAMSPVVHTLNISSWGRGGTFFSFPVAVYNSIKIGPLVFLL